MLCSVAAFSTAVQGVTAKQLYRELLKQIQQLPQK
jgi:hypothetical protein